MNDKIFAALSSFTRRKILAYLSGTDLTSSEIASCFNISKPAISKHLSILENAGLVASLKEGQYVTYSLVRENLVTNMHDFLADFCPVSRKIKQESSAIERYKKESLNDPSSDS